MSINLFHTFLLLLFITCCACQCAYAKEIAPSGRSKKVELFKTNELINNIIKPENGGGKGDGENITPSAFYLPLIVATDDVMVALTGVNRTDSDSDSDKHVDILTKYITTYGNDWPATAINNNAGWKVQFAFQEKENNKKNFVKGFAAAAKENKIYILLLNKTENGESDTNCGIQLVEGTINGETEDDIKIEWETKDISSSFTDGELKNCLTEMQPSNYLSASSVYLATEKKIVFVVHGRSSEDNNNNKIYAFISLDVTTKDSVKLLYEGNIESKCYFDFFLWEDKIMMIPTLCEENSEKTKIVNKSNNMSKIFTDGVEPFGRLLGFMREKSDFTTTKINNISVVLFTQLKPKTSTGDNGQKKYYDDVWFTDGNRVSTVGRMAADDNVAFSKLLHTKGKLFALHDIIKTETSESITLSYLEEQLQNITTVIDSWKKSDDVVKNLFTDTSSDTGNFIDGLVGFLSNRSADNKNEWIDEYYYVNATVTGGNKVTCGFKFKGNGAGVQWPVGKNKEDQPYNFINPGFTLVANVTIDGDAGDKGNSVLGVVYKETNGNNDNKRIGLRCNTKNEWEVTDNGVSPKILSNGKQCQLGSTYLVALILNNGECSVQINGEKPSENRISIEPSANITHFYFGADNGIEDAESHVTVTNVLLYNRPLSKDVIKQLKISKNEEQKQDIDSQIQNSSDGINTHKGKETTGDGTDDKKGTSDQSNDTGENNNNSNNDAEETLSSTPENSIMRGGVVGVLLFFLLLLLNACV